MRLQQHPAVLCVAGWCCLCLAALCGVAVSSLPACA